VSVVDPEMVKPMVATVPFAMVLELIPQITHVEVPGVLLLQVTDFEAALADPATATLIAVKSLVA